MFHPDAAAIRSYHQLAELIDSYDETLRLVSMEIRDEADRIVNSHPDAAHVEADSIEAVAADLDVVDQLRDRLRAHGRGGHAGVASQRLTTIYAQIDRLASGWLDGHIARCAAQPPV